MDPAACLTRCDQAISDCDLHEAADALADYRLWRSRGGFEPNDVHGKRGDKFADECARRIDDQHRSRHDENQDA